MFKSQGWQRSARLLAVSSVLLLAACGGGGGGDSSSGGGSATYYTVTVSTTGNGSVSPSDPQSVASNGSVMFTATPDAGWRTSGISTSGASSCLSNSDFSTGTGTYTVANPRADCSFTVNFTQITHTVTAKVASGNLLPMTTASVTTAQTPDFLALDAANSQAYVVKTDGANGAIAVHAVDTSGELASTAAVTLDAPYISAGCSELASGAALSSRCLVVGPQGSNAAGHVYAILDKTCTSPTTCTDVPTIRVYNTTAGTLTKVVDTDLAAGFSTVSFKSVTSIALSPSTNRLVLTGVVQQDGSSALEQALFLCAIDTDGKLTGLSMLHGYTSVLGNVVANPASDNIYVSYQQNGAAGGQDEAGVYQYFIGTNDTLNSQMKYYFTGDDTVTREFVINGSDAYLVIDRVLVETSYKTLLARYTIDMTTGDLTSGGNSLLAFDNVDGAALRLGQTGDTGYLVVKSFAGAGDANNRTTVSRVDIGTNGALTVGDDIVSVAGDATHNLVIDAAGAHAYLTNPDQPAISQYWISAVHGTVTPATQTVNDGDTATVAVSPDAGYQAVVSGCGGALASGSYTTAPVTTDCTVTAAFVTD